MSSMKHVWTLHNPRHIIVFYLKNENLMYKTITLFIRGRFHYFAKRSTNIGRIYLIQFLPKRAIKLLLKCDINNCLRLIPL
jgi:hypothetical protein